RHPNDHTKYRILARQDISQIEPLQVEVLREGDLVYDLPDLERMRSLREMDVERLDSGVRRIMYPHIYHVSLTRGLWDLKQQLIAKAMSESH
ncbi:MAG: hypothetical protein P8Z00_18575, partial [Anaerolineales bacterium]